jgi:hypothetical protein
METNFPYNPLHQTRASLHCMFGTHTLNLNYTDAKKHLWLCLPTSEDSNVQRWCISFPQYHYQQRYGGSRCISCVPVYLLFSKRGVLGSGHAAQAQTIAGRYACHCSSEVYRQIDAYALADVCTVPFVSAITATLKYYFFYAKH